MTTGYKIQVTVPEALVPAVEGGLEAAFDDGEGWAPGISSWADTETPDLWTVEAFFAADPDPVRVGHAERLATEAAGVALPAFTPEALPDVDWVSESQKLLKPIHAGRYLVHGAYDRARRRPGRVNLEIEAGQAFGTGRHETTAGCLLSLDALAKRQTFRPRNGLDLGCGSGLLAFAMARTCAMPVLASDIDPIAVATAVENAQVNAVPVRPVAGGTWGVEAVTASGLDHPVFRRSGPFDLVAANILAGPLIRLAPALAPLVAPGGRLILAGLLAEQRAGVERAYRDRGLVLEARRPIGQWPTLLFRRPGTRRTARLARSAMAARNTGGAGAPMGFNLRNL
ncbi:[LSU ribosomal protein L11P]-lysine N-methyltransferase [Rhodothalassium salexigens DSM 2132]|uniref:Ribosomal protein L11 methyltransferase n=1 Tax=Rhodothalassium salexigens DSM 2132 TaxID=1188247 RepID=A0A4R2P5N3_RHOSA|nr:50S ribosomal protein L11 methyltransferase [Rhodothalassium salexigens]MBB4212727.1 ribosomal protein L11 methyltransferase [Rhodothalassium salexigens DSM 2132]MBK1639230.1 hypothetical protein [Rhodothalassium salexigens DSM 2132]TCP30170.1 [LSU ribosomal protein L11P]-lysine N-methyltransferase [Rhodothalassium salexigens DSM 2132]